jgi:hypothetical protein
VPNSLSGLEQNKIAKDGLIFRPTLGLFWTHQSPGRAEAAGTFDVTGALTPGLSRLREPDDA